MCTIQLQVVVGELSTALVALSAVFDQHALAAGDLERAFELRGVHFGSGIAAGSASDAHALDHFHLCSKTVFAHFDWSELFATAPARNFMIDESAHALVRTLVHSIGHIQEKHATTSSWAS